MNYKKGLIRFKHSQVTIFIVIAILIVVVVLGIFFYFKSFDNLNNIPSEFEPFYNSFLYCLEINSINGVNLLESQGGYISLPEKELGSEYIPFGSQLDFMGISIPYWYYISENNIPKEQIPSKENMENDLSDFIEETANKCLSELEYEEGFQIFKKEPKANVEIKNREIKINLKMDLSFIKNNDSFFIDNHDLIINSNLGKLYDSAKKIYNKEKNEFFLEKYGVDILRLYAPVDGVEVTCEPLVWNSDEIFEDLRDAIEINTLSLKNDNNDYSLKKEENKYFVMDLGVDENVKFFNFKNWPSSFEVNPTDKNNPLLIAKPIGNQQGLGILGFCYVPYHFVYNMNYPILIQISDSNSGEIFQFPVAIVIKDNLPRESLGSSVSINEKELELCNHKVIPLKVSVYDSRLKPINAEIFYECLGTVCKIGKTSNGILIAEFPQCYNGYIIAENEDYKESRNLHSTINKDQIDIFLDKLYEKKVQIGINDKNYNGNAIINFVRDNSSITISYPEQKTVKLSEGQYEIQVYVYSSSSIKLEESSYEECIDVPLSGFGGLFGLTKEKCFNVDIPSQIISNALISGGKENYYILESELKSSETIIINTEYFNKPEKLSDLQENYDKLDRSDLEVIFK
jgi:hypothetical protein